MGGGCGGGRGGVKFLYRPAMQVILVNFNFCPFFSCKRLQAGSVSGPLGMVEGSGGVRYELEPGAVTVKNQGERESCKIMIVS